MLKRLLASLTALTALSLAAGAQIRLDYDLGFDFRFDNREYDRSLFQASKTLFGARLAPMVGFNADAGRTSHRLMAGVDALKEFGTSDNEMRCNLLFYYQLGVKFPHTDFRITAGLFPRSFSRGDWSPVFFSDELKFYDNTFEGILFSWDREKSRFELGCDWTGMFSQTRREEFMIFSSGDYRPLKWLRLGYEAYLMHYACSGKVNSVCDNFLAEPHITFDFAPFAHIQKLSLRAGWIQALQRDRAAVGHFVAPFAGEILLGVQNWGVGIENRLSIGKNLLPYYQWTDAAGTLYGEGNFYKGDAFYRMTDPRWTSMTLATDTTSEIQSGLYDRLEVYYAPRICRGVNLKASVFLHFHLKQFSGTSQTVSLLFDLHELMRGLPHKGNRRHPRPEPCPEPCPEGICEPF